MQKPNHFHPRQRYVVGISGGKDSTAALLWMIHESGVPVEQIIAVFSDTGNEHQFTYDHIDMLAKRVHPIKRLEPRLGFYELAREKKGFPGATKRFCTEYLKIEPATEYIAEIRGGVLEPISVSGVRADESLDRADALEWDYSGYMLCKVWRPLVKWTFPDVVALHEKHGIPMNPLYALGARRVGCFPCVMSSKEEIRTIALNFPERIDEIRKWEKIISADLGKPATFFRPNVCPERFCSQIWVNKAGEPVPVPTIDDVVRWALTGDRAQGAWDDAPKKEAISCRSGHCE